MSYLDKLDMIKLTIFIVSMWFDNNIHDNWFRNGTFWLRLVIRQTKFTDKIYARAYTLDDLVGTCGGYIGLFLGYALIQLPRLMADTFQILKNKITNRNSIDTI